jgi:MGT family glycosyltransferase
MTHGRRTAAFIASGYRSHFYPTLSLARALEARGVDVLYCLIDTTDGIAAEITRAGYRCADLSGLLKFRALAGLIKQARVHRARALLRQQAEAFKTFAEQHGIDLCLVDNFLRPFAGLATFNGIPVVSVCYNYSENVRVSRPLEPHDAMAAADKPQIRRGGLPMRRWMKAPGVLVDWCVGVQREIARTAARQGLGTEYSIYNQLRVFTYPTLVLAPRELLWPGECGGLYLGLCVTERESDVAPVPPAAHARPLVYVTLGTLNHKFAGSRRFFAEAVKAFADHRQVRVLLQIGSRFSASDLGPLPDHVEAQAYVTQRAVIEQASLVITHGGLGTIKECIHAGRPMLVFPTETEQLDNAHRVVAHGLGLRGDALRTTAADIRAHATRILDDDGFARRVRSLRDAARSGAALDEGADFVTNLLPASHRPLRHA